MEGIPLAPPELKAVHPLGKSPVITDGGKTIAESGAIVEYILDRYGNGRMRPKPGTDDHWKYVEWMHFAEGSAMTPLLLALYCSLLGEPRRRCSRASTARSRTTSRTSRPALGDRQFFVGNELTGADIQLLLRPRGGGLAARAVSAPRRVPRSHARAAGVQARHREGRPVPADGTIGARDQFPPLARKTSSRSSRADG